jgi:hypothetical protein
VLWLGPVIPDFGYWRVDGGLDGDTHIVIYYDYTLENLNSSDLL